MKVKTRYAKSQEWKETDAKLLNYYFGTDSAKEIKDNYFGNKRVIKKMNLYFTISNK